MIEFAIERLSDILEEIKPLHQEQWEETEEYRSKAIPLDIDYARYLEFNKTGYYTVFTARDSGKLVGHISVYMTISMHTRTKIAQEDSLFLTKSARGGRTAMRLFQFVENWLKSQGVLELYCSVKNGANSRRLLEYMGCRHVSDGFHKLL